MASRSLIPNYSRCFLAGLVLLLGMGLPRMAAAADLDDYVRADDGAFAWKLVSQTPFAGGTIHELELTSQVWHEITWKHALTVYEPAKLTTRDAALLFITGGSTGRKPGEKDHLMGFTLAAATGARVAMLHQVPNQPLLGDKTEDALIAETFVRYLETKDRTWPLLFPMAKSAVKAMDAVQAWSREHGNGGAITRFVVSGASKRGWTTWLTGAVDPRVIGIAPMVIVTLNMGPQGPNQLDVWGQYSEQIEDYTKRGLLKRAQTEEGTALWKMVDPYSFRDRLTMPKLLINGTNDRYWTLNALDLYWDGLRDRKHVVALPNAGHGLDQNRDWALNTLGAFFRLTVEGKPLPAISWTKDEKTAETPALKVAADPAPVAARLWTATSATRDFRESKWTSTPLTAAPAITAALPRPDAAHQAAFVELEYQIDGLTYHLTTTFFEPGTKDVSRQAILSAEPPVGIFDRVGGRSNFVFDYVKSENHVVTYRGWFVVGPAEAEDASYLLNARIMDRANRVFVKADLKKVKVPAKAGNLSYEFRGEAIVPSGELFLVMTAYEPDVVVIYDVGAPGQKIEPSIRCMSPYPIKVP